MDIDFILFSLTPMVLFLAICMDLLNSIISASGDKSVLAVLAKPDDNSDEQKALRTALRKILFRYLPIFLFLLADFGRMKFGLDLLTMRILHLVLEIWILIYNWDVLGLNISALGGAMNMLVCAMNRGFMPTILPPDLDGRHILMTGSTRLNFLCDWIALPSGMFSLGDILQVIGPILFLIFQNYVFFKLMRKRAVVSAGR